MADGASNMAIDHALLDAVDADPASAVLRTYGWTAPTLSLGYFQAIADARADRRWDRLAIVRRPSGGGALLHHHELTYALVVPRAHPLPAKPSDLYRAVHAAIGSILSRHGIDSERRGEAERDGRPFLCFLDRDPEDLVLGAAKIVGSAQRRRPRAVLQHGSILVRRSTFAQELPGIEEVAGSTPEVDVVAEWIARELPSALVMEPRPDSLREAEELAARELSLAVYGDDGWTARR